MSWFLLTILFIIVASISNILRKILLNEAKNDTVASAITFQFLGAIMVGVIALIHGFVMPPFVQHPVNFLLQACLWGIATLSLFKAYEYNEASEVTIITTSEAIFTIIVAIIFLG